MSVPSMSLDGKVAIVTGAAGKNGLGCAIARMFAEAGADVAILDIVAEGDDRNIDNVVGDIRALGRRSVGIQGDVSSKADVDRMVQQVTDELGPVDILVNNAAILGKGLLYEMEEDDWDRVMDINLKGSYLCAQAVAPGMMARKRGGIVNVASINAHAAIPGRLGYCTSKIGVTMLTRVLALDLGKHNIRVNAISPGAMRTDMGQHKLDTGRDPVVLDGEAKKRMDGFYAAKIPLGRMADPSEMASAALFLASDAASYITGVTIYVDGGWLAGWLS